MDDLDALVQHEKSKYEKAYQRLRYRSKSPHWRCKDRILEEMRLLKVQEYANFGCGSGLLDRYLLQQAEGILVDHVQVLWPDVKEHPNLRKFIEASLFTDFEHRGAFRGLDRRDGAHSARTGGRVLENIAKRADSCFFQISLNASGERDEEKYGGHLHLTVETPEWWEKKLLSWFGKLSNPMVDTQKAEAPWQPDKSWYLVTALRSMSATKSPVISWPFRRRTVAFGAPFSNRTSTISPDSEAPATSRPGEEASASPTDYGEHEDVVHFHRTCRDALAPFGADLHPRFKRWCDEYFFLKHRGDPRGVGGIFFDDLSAPDFTTCFAVVRSVGDSFLPAYEPIVERRRRVAYGERERDFQAYRRGRYVEFNLVYDRGTLFGLQSGGRTESILMSLPPRVRWGYCETPAEGTPESALLKELQADT